MHEQHEAAKTVVPIVQPATKPSGRPSSQGQNVASETGREPQRDQIAKPATIRCAAVCASATTRRATVATQLGLLAAQVGLDVDAGEQPAEQQQRDRDAPCRRRRSKNSKKPVDLAWREALQPRWALDGASIRRRAAQQREAISA